ncbi:MAG: thioredoxin family protein, partial [Planctomycetes bacterium]|nr:thioredoxin family protein [Planctomycetota bacterium]
MLKATLLSLCLAVPAFGQHPTLFSKLDFPAAQAQAKTQKKLLLLDAMTSWCGPCKMMDATTWVDPRVEAWVAQHAVAVQLDMDVHTALKESLGINAFPTMVLFTADGKEFDRIVGSRNAEQMLEWLGGALGGEKEIDRVRAALAELNASGEARTRDRMLLAERAADLGANQEVGEQLVWLWTRKAVDEAESQLLSTWRRGTGRNLTSEFLARFGEWRPAILAQRDARASVLREKEATDVRSEWITLNGVLGEEDSTVVWAAGWAIDRDARAVLRAHESQLFDLLVDRELWAAAGHCLDDPLKQQRFLGENLGA